MISKLWLSGFVLGVSLFTPISSYTLGIDFYDIAFPDAQVAVKITACYEGAFVAFQLLCHFLDSRLPISRAARIEIRHIVVSCLMVFIIIWDRVIIGADSITAPNHALGILLAAVTLNGVLDGLAVGAIFGEAAVLGPSSAHALVAGTAGVMPILAVLRIIFKAALPPTTAGLRLSIVLYFATAAVVLLAGLAVYCFVVLPAITEVEFGAKSMRYLEELGVMPLVPTITFGNHNTDTADASHGKVSDAVICTDQIGITRPAMSKVVSAHSLKARSSSIHTAYSLPSSIRGTSLIVRRVHTGFQPDLLRSATAEGAVSFMERTGTLDSKATGPRSLGSHLLFGAAGRPRSELPAHAQQRRQQQQQQLQRQMTPYPHAVHPVHASALATASACGAPTAVLTGVTDTIPEGDTEGEDGVGRSSVRSQQQQQQQQQQQHDPVMSTAVAGNAASNDQCQQYVEATVPITSGQHSSPFSHFAHHALLSDKSSHSIAGQAPAGLKVHLVPRKEQQSTGWPAAISVQDFRAASRSGAVLSVMQSMLSKARSSRDHAPQYMVPGQSVWRSNWLVAKGNVWYMLGTVLTYACNYGIFPAFISYIHYAPLGTWYSLLLVTTYGVGDLTGKLLPLWRPVKPQVTIMAVAITRLAVFFTAFAVALLFNAGPYVFFPLVFILSLSGWYEAMIFSLACEGHHPDDAYAVESLLAIQLDVGIAVGSVLSLAWGAGPWAVGASGAAAPHG